MSQVLRLQWAAAATLSFVAALEAPCRVEAKVASHDGMPLLSAVETALAGALSRPARHELVWLSGAPHSGLHVLRLQAFGSDNTLLGEAVHEFAG
jgi:hypothetical protein